MSFTITNPAASISRGVEKLTIIRKNSSSLTVKGFCWLGALPLSTVGLPLALSAELFLKHLPKTAQTFCYRNKSDEHRQKHQEQQEKIYSFAWGIFTAPILGLRSTHFVPSFFLKIPESRTEIRPFGVEAIYGKKIAYIDEPKSVGELIECVNRGRRTGRQISIVGSGMSQGTQTVPVNNKQMLIRMKHLNKIEIDVEKMVVKVQAGATLEELQLALNAVGMSMIVKQASDPFSIGGAIGANAHGWAHQFGSIVHTVESLVIIDAEGKLIELKPDHELFGCMFGTWGYFGVVVSATIKITKNVYLKESTDIVELDDFVKEYEDKIKENPNIPLFGGRLPIGDINNAPLRKVCMVRYTYDEEANDEVGDQPLITRNFTKEPPRGTRIERVGLSAISHVSSWTARVLINLFWKGEKNDMLKGKELLTRNESLHPPINAFKMLHNSNLNAQWLQEYFIKPNKLANFLRYLGSELKVNGIHLTNATIRPAPKDEISILPYAEVDRYAVVICFDQLKTESEIKKTRQMIEEITKYLVNDEGVYYQAYMPFATREQFEKCYGIERVNKMRELKEKYDPNHVYGNAHTAKYYDEIQENNILLPKENSVDIQIYRDANQHLNSEVRDFLNIIFQQVDTDKFMTIFKEVIENENYTTGMEVYNELLKRAKEAKGGFITQTRKSLKALADERDPLLANIAKISDPGFKRQGGVLEIGLVRHIKGVSKLMGLQGKSAFMNDYERPLDIIQCGFPRPYKKFISYTSQHEPLIKGEFQGQPISVVLMAAGIHHCPNNNLIPFLHSIYDVLEPGGIFLLRDHDAHTDDLVKVADMAHRFFNVLTGVRPGDEEMEIRNFNSLDHFIALIESVGFKQASDPLIRTGDPTMNSLVKFYKPLSDVMEGHIGLIREGLINKCNERILTKRYVRPLLQTSFSRVEWFNVESERAMANAYAKHVFWNYHHFKDIKETAMIYAKSFRIAAKSTSFWETFLSDYNVMNSTILTATCMQNAVRGTFNTLIAVMSAMGCILPYRKDEDWQAPANYYGEWMKEYSDSLEVIPSYEHPYTAKLGEFFRRLKNSYNTVRQRRSLISLATDMQTYKNVVTGVSMTGDLLWRQLFASLVKTIYGGQENGDAREIGLIIKADDYSFLGNIESDKLKDSMVIEGNPYRGLIVTRYSKLTDMMKILSDNNAEIVEIAGQRSIEIELTVDQDAETPKLEGVEELYRRENLLIDNQTIIAYSVPMNQVGAVFKNFGDKIHRVYDY